MTRYSFEGLAKRCPQDKLYAWYTDFTPEDADILRNNLQKRVSLQPVSRKLVTKEGNHVKIESLYRSKKRELKLHQNILLSPPTFTYEAETAVPKIATDQRKYTFIETPEGTKVTVDGEYKMLNVGLKIADAFGLVKRRFVNESQEIMQAFLRAAEDEINR
ncbi:MAG: hypothetical protein ACE5KO_06170 [Candidatus Bathyarchaeia archaeon]